MRQGLAAFFVPKNHLISVRNALKFLALAGIIKPKAPLISQCYITARINECLAVVLADISGQNNCYFARHALTEFIYTYAFQSHPNILRI